MDVLVVHEGDHLTWTPTLTGGIEGLLTAPDPIRLAAVDDRRFGVIDAEGTLHPGVIEFLEPDDSGRPRYVWAGHIARRVDGYPVSHRLQHLGTDHRPDVPRRRRRAGGPR